LFCVAARGREKGCIPRFLPEKALAFSKAIDAILSTYLLQAVCFMIWGINMQFLIHFDHLSENLVI
jgi:hypothetical protein